jgi:hypothetical protein
MNNTPTEKSKQKNGEFIPNFTQYPNEILDNWMPHLSGNQTKIINVFVRQIYGYHKEYDKISVRQISSKTGIPISGVFRDLKILLSIGAIRILKHGDKINPHTYQIVNVTEVLAEREHHKKPKGVIGEITGCYRSDNSGVSGEITEVLAEREQQKKEIKEIKCEIKEIVPNHREQRTELAHTSKMESYSVERLLEKSNNFLQQVGFGFSKNPRYILDQIYKLLPDDYQVKEDAKDTEILKQAIDKFDSSSGAERDAISKKLFQGVEAMAKLYMIKKYGEEFRDVLYPKILNDNLILYLNCNPTLKYCLQGFSNDIDGVYSEITRIVRKKIEKNRLEYEKDRERVIERERVKEVMLNRPNLSDDQIHAMGLRTVPDIINAMNKRNCDTNIELLDEKYRPIMQLDERDKLREEELLRIMVSGTKLSMDEQLEFDILRRKKAVG